VEHENIAQTNVQRKICCVNMLNFFIFGTWDVLNLKLKI